MKPAPANESGQALTEFVFLLPVLLLILFCAVQIIVVADCHQRTQMATWFAMRSQTYDTSHHFVKKSEVQEILERDMFPKEDEVRVSSRTRLRYIATVECRTPYLFQRVRWAALQSVFSDQVSEGRIEVASENRMLWE